MINKTKLILTADDYGMCEEVSDAIEDLAERGCLTSTNVMTNFNTDFTESPLRKYNNFSIGIHWNVTTGRPVLSAENVPSLVDDNGYFYPLVEFRRRFRSHLINVKELADELNAQYEVFFSSFGKADYWNTHENVGLYPAEYQVFERVALKKAIRCTRNFQRVYIDYDLVNSTQRRLREFAVRNFINFWFGYLAKKRFVMPEARVVTFFNSSKTDLDRVKKGLILSKRKSIEVVIHPATNGNNPLFGNIREDRVREYQCYKSKEFKELFYSELFEMVSYANLL